ncbi:class I SAM-dependent methyltransferase [Patescibacteria group bacterium]|nr:class I SAM-dependent methyltransferase [Patescibacteria group bacterium]
MKNKNLRYYNNARKDIIKIIPKNVKKILSLGCGAGITEKILEEKHIKVTGIELNKKIAETAKKNMTKVFVGNIEKINIPFKKYFDCILYADSLEHLTNPQKSLILTEKYLKDKGFLIISFPNIRFWYTFYMLFFKKDWMYSDRGIFDSTHLKFFTLKSMKRLLKETGYKIVNVKRNYRLFEFPTKYNRLAKFISIIFFKDLLTFQFIVVAEKIK